MVRRTNRKRYPKRIMVARSALVRPTRNRRVISQRKAAKKSQSLSFGSPSGWMTTRSPFPPNLWTTFTYSEVASLQQTTGGVPAVLQYRANGPFDPRVAAGGLQPRYYDSLLGPDGGTAPYRTYRVHASKIKLSIFPTSTTAPAANGIITVIPQRSATSVPLTLAEQRERAYGKSCAVTTVGSWKPYKLGSFTKMKYHLGHKDLMDVDSTAARYDANPGEQVYWNICGCAIDGGQNLIVNVQVTITYYVQLYTLADVEDS